MKIGLLRVQWFRPAKAWETASAWRKQRRAMQGDFTAARTEAVNGFANAAGNRILGGGQLAAQAAGQRLAAQFKAKLDTLA